ncbi:hypothetical protein [Vitiosangium sp. GDMCC 1.1324]|uniref:hypothetical protein n=1 Tax=Vitiosangium sp. (strain GDMCC 1.1324) TaxID=2138576 RepID=UPI000D3CFE65|nr:hypothetical protein [Vitiosangium sp. GDMCC 1.1324]PTL79132.1 hypothetical protein DAT35_36625 [Vitiosangium sp. GDMCC 1.1324]
MKKWTRVLCVVSVASFVMTGCKGSVCEDLKDGLEVAADKGAACDTSGEAPEEADINQCKQSIEKCTEDDEDTLRDLADCFRDLPECTPSNPDPYSGALLGCFFTAAGKLSDACGGAVFSSGMPRQAVNYSIAR